MKILKPLSISVFCFLMTLFSLLFDIGESNCKTYAYDEFVSEQSISKTSPLNEIPMKTVTLNNVVRVYFPENGSIEVLDIEEYVCGVLTGEMYSSSSDEALKAVAVAARTYTQYMCSKNKEKEYDVAAEHSVSQAYISLDDAVTTWGGAGKEKYEIMKKAVRSTEGEILMFDGSLICSFYHASSFPFTENCENVFVEKLPYLSGKKSVENKENAYMSNKRFNLESLNDILRKHGYPELSEISKVENVLNENYRCEYLLFQSNDISFVINGREVRQLFGLNSTSFDILSTKDTLDFIIYGFGHGVGLSQNGADVMAKSGASYNEILNFYYEGAEIFKTIYKQWIYTVQKVKNIGELKRNEVNKYAQKT